MKYLFFDTETTGLPLDWSAPLTDFNNWPRLVQIAWALYTEKAELIAQKTDIVVPEGFEIPEQAAKIHRITTERAHKEGRALRSVLSTFHYQLKQADVVIGHNVSFDNKVVGSELLRLGFPKISPPRKKICTMLSATHYCRIRTNRGYKWPSLYELHMKLFNSEFKDAHDAGFDVVATIRCFWELKRLGIIKVD